MTIGIAAHATWEARENIVLCGDWQIGDDASTWETSKKFNEYFGEGLVSLASGNFEDVGDLLAIYRKKLGGMAFSLLDLKQYLHEGMQEFLDVLSLRGKVGTDVQLLVCGFVEQQATILYVDANGVMTPFPYSAIGSGATNADAILRWRMARETRPFFSDLMDVLYFAYEAKRFAELSPHVGKRLTELIILSPSLIGHVAMTFMHSSVVEFLSGEFSKYGPQELPQDRDKIPNFPNTLTDLSGHRRGNP